jgi:hypothetical protein
MNDKLLSYADLEARWQPPSATPKARRKWIIRRCQDWGIRALSGTRGKDARFRPVDVLKGEARAVGEKGVRA